MNKAGCRKWLFQMKIKYNPTRRAQIREGFGIVFGIALMIAGFVGFGCFIWTLADGCSLLEKVYWTIGMYLLTGLTAYVASIPGVGCIPVKFYQ